MRKITYWLALILIFMLPWEDRISFMAVGSMARLMGLVVAAFWLTTIVIEGRFRKPHLFQGLALLFFLWNVVSILWSLDLEYTIQRAKTYSQIFLLLLIYWEVFEKTEHLIAGLQAYICGSYVLIASTIFNYVSGNVAVAYEGRYSATGINANELTLILVIGLPIAMHLFFMTGKGGKGATLKIIYLAYVPLAIYSTILTGSRTALIAIVPFVFFMIGTQQIKFDQKLLIFALLFVALMIFLPFIPQSMLNRLSTIGSSIGEGDLGGRLNLWRETIAVFAQHPISGIGSGAIISNIGSAAHNTFLSIAAETGLIGFLLFVSILGTVLYHAVSLPKGLSGLWLTILLTWVIGVNSLSWEFRKLTWILLSFVILQSSAGAPLAAQDAKKPFSGIIRPSQTLGDSMPETKVI